MTTNKQIWDDFRKGKSYALSHIYYQHVQMLYRYGKKISQDNELIKDTIQDLFFDLIRTRKNLGKTDNIRFYLMASFRRKLAKAMKHKIPLKHNGDEEMTAEIVYSAEHDFIDKEELTQREQAVKKALAGLTPVVKRENLADSVLVGIWKGDEYIGKYENPNEIGSKSPNINKLMVIKKSISPNQVEINIVRKNSKVGISNLRINTNSGTFYDIKNVINQFPLEMEIEFDSSSATGFGAAKEKFTSKVKIMEPGYWQITISLSNV